MPDIPGVLPHDPERVDGRDPAAGLPFGVSRYYAGLARDEDPAQTPSQPSTFRGTRSLRRFPYESADPIGDSRWPVAERLVHHYPDRALLLVSDRCATYCRHCLRLQFTGHGGGQIDRRQLDPACEYLARTPAVPGGSPVRRRSPTPSDRDLQRVVDRLFQVDPRYILRICTRMPVVSAAVSPTAPCWNARQRGRRCWLSSTRTTRAS